MTTKPRRELVWIHDVADVQAIAIANPLDMYTEERFAQSECLYFSIRADDPKADYIAEDLTVRWRGGYYFIDETRKRREGATALIDVEAPARWLRLADDTNAGTFTLTNVTRDAGLAAILALTTSWTATTIEPDVSGALFSIAANDATVLDLVRKWAKITGTEVQFDTAARTVALAVTVGQNRGAGFRYGRNLTSVTRTAKPPQVTRLYPFGKDDITIAGLNAGIAYLEDFSFYTAQGLTLPQARALYLRERIWSDPSFVTDVDLLAGATAVLANLAQPVVNYEMAVVDLSTLTGVPADQYHVGDSVTVTDTVLGFDIATRVVRVLRRPLEPARDEVELSFLPLPVPDPNVANGRTDTTEEWTLFETRTATARSIRNGSTILARLDLETIDAAEWVVGFSLNALGVGSGTITITVLEDVSGDTLYPPITLDVVAGKPVVHAFTFAEKTIAVGPKALVVRASSSGAGIGADAAIFGSSMWVLARGTTQETLTPASSQRFDYTGAVQTFTVPDDVSEVTIEAHGAAGGSTAGLGYGGSGGKVTAKFAVVAGSVLDVYVGGCARTSAAGGWPDGGAGDIISGGLGYGGGGSSRVGPTGFAVAAAYIVAAGGGGGGAPFTGALQKGGAGGFATGQAAPSALPDGGAAPGGGATQTAGGAGGTGTAANGTAGTAGQGGAAGHNPSAFSFPAGGGGGGWFGGGGGGAMLVLGSGDGGGGGGGSGWIGSNGWDFDYTDAENTDHGFVIISWSPPE